MGRKEVIPFLQALEHQSKELGFFFFFSLREKEATEGN